NRVAWQLGVEEGEEVLVHDVVPEKARIAQRRRDVPGERQRGDDGDAERHAERPQPGADCPRPELAADQLGKRDRRARQRERASAVGPARAMTLAASQYASGGLVRKGSPFIRGVTQSPVSTISRAGSAYIPSVSEKPGRPSRQAKSGAARATTSRSRRFIRPGMPPPRART